MHHLSSRFDSRHLMITTLLSVSVACPVSYGQGLDKMYWSDRGTNEISRANLDGTSAEALVAGLGEARGLAVDFDNYMLYWADNGTDRIERSMLDGTQRETLVEGLGFPAGVALDVARNKVYWADAQNSVLQRADLDGTNVETIVSNGLINPYFVTLDLENEQIYWTDYGTDKIQRANLDGTNVVDLVTSGLGLPRGIDIDVANNRMYWADRQTDVVQRSDLAGNQIETLHEATPSRAAPHGVALDHQRGHVYWVDNGLVTIKRMNLDGSDVVTLLDDSEPRLLRPWQIVLDLTTQAGCVPGDACEPFREVQRLDAITRDLATNPSDLSNDVNRDGQLTEADRQFMIRYAMNSLLGDANVDGYFDSSDLVTVFRAGQYEDAIPSNSTWQTGDWNGDLEFSSRDIVSAFEKGNYEATRTAAVQLPEPESVPSLLLLATLLCLRRRVRSSDVENMTP